MPTPGSSLRTDPTSPDHQWAEFPKRWPCSSAHRSRHPPGLSCTSQ
ncbi:hypothetical protein BACI71_230003 [Bacillus mycoides]|uniref:Uncharacterized protein n=1 Tax=Bacillus mycoides TaxID=1405 RepID=A0A653VZB7_BACMY|nr:hypothetical protein BACI71_230003 [Bacillus mycoides]